MQRPTPGRGVTPDRVQLWNNHHHLICRGCGRMVDVDCAVDYTPCLTPSDDADYEVDEAEVIYWGRCPDCLGRKKSSSSPRRDRSNRRA